MNGRFDVPSAESERKAIVLKAAITRPEDSELPNREQSRDE